MRCIARAWRDAGGALQPPRVHIPLQAPPRPPPVATGPAGAALHRRLTEEPVSNATVARGAPLRSSGSGSGDLAEPGVQPADDEAQPEAQPDAQPDAQPEAQPLVVDREAPTRNSSNSSVVEVPPAAELDHIEPVHVGDGFNGTWGNGSLSGGSSHLRSGQALAPLLGPGRIAARSWAGCRPGLRKRPSAAAAATSPPLLALLRRRRLKLLCLLCLRCALQQGQGGGLARQGEGADLGAQPQLR
jgi:hypothetical protein